VTGASTATPTERLFVACDLPDTARADLAEQACRRARDAGGRPTPPEKLHLTLAFLGPVPIDAIPGVADAVRRACRGHAPITTRQHGTAGIPGAARSRIVAAILEDPDGRLAELAGDVARRMPPLVPGFRPTAAFWPHVTLVRLRRPQPVGSAATPTEQMFAFDRVTLYASRSAPGGTSQYAPLAHVALTARDRPH
jgi:RNA 2',3'-cyclic 3'-phosphodiesterase